MSWIVFCSFYFNVLSMINRDNPKIWNMEKFWLCSINLEYSFYISMGECEKGLRTFLLIYTFSPSPLDILCKITSPWACKREKWDSFGRPLLPRLPLWWSLDQIEDMKVIILSWLAYDLKLGHTAWMCILASHYTSSSFL